jgi:hypothetical protein
MLCGFDDLAAQITQTGNRIRGLLTQIHPALERVFGPRFDYPAALDLLERDPSPAILAGINEDTLANRLTKLAPHMGKGLAAEIGWEKRRVVREVQRRTISRRTAHAQLDARSIRVARSDAHHRTA